MSNLILIALWAVLYLLCGALGIVSGPGWVGVLACLAFFVPPVALLHRAKRTQNRKIVKWIRNLSAAWLAATLVLLILNILSVGMSETAGDILYYMLVVVASPMVCGGYWFIALFGWACLLMTALQLHKKM